MEIGILGTSIWQQNSALMAALTLPRENRAALLVELKTALEVEELVYVATCNRVELIYAANSRETGDRILYRLLDFFFSNGRSLSFFPNDFYHYQSREALTHLFRTVSSLESMVLGENQIAGQFKTALDEARELGLAGTALDILGQRAVLVARKVKAETNIGAGNVSMASLAALEIQQLSEISEKGLTVALVGAGEMSRKLAGYLHKLNVSRIIFVNRTVERAEDLAKRFGGEAVSLDNFLNAPGEIDVVVSSTGADGAIFDGLFVDLIADLPRPLLCIDLAMPPDFADELKSDSRCRVVDIQMLKGRAQANLRRKFVEADRANAIVREAVEQFLTSRVEVSLKPIFAESYQQSLRLANSALNDLFSKRLTSLSEEDQQAITRLVEKLIGHSVFQPAKELSDRLVKVQHNLDQLQHLTKEAV